MPRRKKNNHDQPIGVGMTAKKMKRKRPINSDLLIGVDPLTDNQTRLFESYKEGKKISFMDGIEAFFVILKYKFFK